MANFSDLTRKEQVLEYLKARIGQWVDGPELANEVVGGSEGLKRLRELKGEGYLIQMRSHPDKALDIYQYRLAEQVRIVDEPTPQPYAPSRPAQAPPQPAQRSAFEPGVRRSRDEPSWGQWKLTNPVTQERTITLWVGKQRLVGTIVLDAGGERWFWGLKLPAYTPRKGAGMPHRERRWGGSIGMGGHDGMEQAQNCVYEEVARLRREGIPHD